MYLLIYCEAKVHTHVEIAGLKYKIKIINNDILLWILIVNFCNTYSVACYLLLRFFFILVVLVFHIGLRSFSFCIPMY